MEKKVAIAPVKKIKISKKLFNPDWEAINKALEDPKKRAAVFDQFNQVKTTLNQKAQTVIFVESLKNNIEHYKKLVSLKPGAILTYTGTGPMKGKPVEKITDGIKTMKVKFEGKTCLCYYANLSLKT